MEGLRNNTVQYVPGTLKITKAIILSLEDYEKLAEDISPEYPFLKDNRDLMKADRGGRFHALLAMTETGSEGMLLAQGKGGLYVGLSRDVQKLDLQGIPTERIKLEEPTVYQERAVFYRKPCNVEDIKNQDPRRTTSERQMNFRVEMAVVLEDTQYGQFKKIGLQEDHGPGFCGLTPMSSVGIACLSKVRTAKTEFSWRRKDMPTPVMQHLSPIATDCV